MILTVILKPSVMYSGDQLHHFSKCHKCQPRIKVLNIVFCMSLIVVLFRVAFEFLAIQELIFIVYITTLLTSSSVYYCYYKYDKEAYPMNLLLHIMG